MKSLYKRENVFALFGCDTFTIFLYFLYNFNDRKDGKIDYISESEMIPRAKMN